MSDSAGTAVASRGDDAKGPKVGRGLHPLAWVADRVRRVITYIRQVVAELRKVIWPTRQELITYTTVVLVFVVIMVSVVAVLDFGFTKAVLTIFGK